MNKINDMDPELDFTSPLFNPLKALNSPHVTLPCPDVQPCDNLDQYVSIMKGKRSSAAFDKDKTTTLPIENTKEKTSQYKMSTKTVLNFMSECSGPFALLQQCFTDHKYIQVWIRHSRGLRGYCYGYIIAFDRHFNMVLSDVTEYCTPLRTYSNGGKSRKKKKSKRNICQEEKTLSNGEGIRDTTHLHKWERTHYINQLFIRGDNVILVRPVEK